MFHSAGYIISMVTMNSNQVNFNLLPDDALVAIGKWVGATGAENFARCLKVNRRFRTVLGQPSVLKDIIEGTTKNITPGIETLEHLAIWEAAQAMALFEENRIGFAYGSLAMGLDDFPDIKNSQLRTTLIARILYRFPQTFVRIEAHCGTAAPPGISESFARSRGGIVQTNLLVKLADAGVLDGHPGLFDRRRDEMELLRQRLRVTGWGRRVAEAAEHSAHRYATVARHGKGWVELYLCYGEHVEIPSRPPYYSGPIREADESDESDDDEFGGHVIVVQDWRDTESTDDEESGSDMDDSDHDMNGTHSHPSDAYEVLSTDSEFNNDEMSEESAGE